MKILIEGSPLFRAKAGVGYYLYHLLDNLAKLGPSHEWVVFGFLFLGKPPLKIFKERRVNLRAKYIRFLPGRVYYNLLRRLTVPPIDLLLGVRKSIFLFPNFVVWPLFFKHRVVVIIYDLSFIHYGQFTFANERKFLARTVPHSIRKSDRIITISESSKREIMEYYRVDPAKITVAYPAVDHSLFRPIQKSGARSVAAKYQLDSDYILFTGSIEPRKNVTGLLKAYSLLSEDLKARYSLVLAGGKGWNDEDILQLISKLKKAGEGIISLGYVPEPDLPAIYSAASMFVFPAFYEGFGMPVLEAMACGVPVITSNNSSLPEVAGDAAILIDATKTEEITGAMTKVLQNTQLQRKMREKGMVQSRKFNWEDSARKVLAVIEKVGK